MYMPRLMVGGESAEKRERRAGGHIPYVSIKVAELLKRYEAKGMASGERNAGTGAGMGIPPSTRNLTSFRSVRGCGSSLKSHSSCVEYVHTGTSVGVSVSLGWRLARCEMPDARWQMTDARKEKRHAQIRLVFLLQRILACRLERLFDVDCLFRRRLEAARGGQGPVNE